MASLFGDMLCSCATADDSVSIMSNRKKKNSSRRPLDDVVDATYKNNWTNAHPWMEALPIVNNEKDYRSDSDDGDWESLPSMVQEALRKQTHQHSSVATRLAVLHRTPTRRENKKIDSSTTKFLTQFPPAVRQNTIPTDRRTKNIEKRQVSDQLEQ